MAYTLLRCSCGIALSIKFLRWRHSDLDYTGTPFQEIHLEILVRTAAAMAAQDGGTIQCQNHDSSLYSKLKKIYIYIILYIWMIFWDDLGCIPVCIISYYEYSWMLFFRVAHHLSCNPSWQLESWGAVVWENVSTEQLGRFGVDGVLLKLYIYILQAMSATSFAGMG